MLIFCIQFLKLLADPHVAVIMWVGKLLVPRRCIPTHIFNTLGLEFPKKPSLQSAIYIHSGIRKNMILWLVLKKK